MLENEENELYREVIMEHYKNPRSSGLVDGLCVFSAKNPTCGDNVSVQIEYDENQKIKDIHQKCIGCSISISSASILTELLVGKTKEQAINLVENFLKMIKGEKYDENLDFKDAVVFKNISSYPARYKCAAVSWQLVLDVLKKGV